MHIHKHELDCGIDGFNCYSCSCGDEYWVLSVTTPERVMELEVSHLPFGKNMCDRLKTLDRQLSAQKHQLIADRKTIRAILSRGKKGQTSSPTEQV